MLPKRAELITVSMSFRHGPQRQKTISYSRSGGNGPATMNCVPPISRFCENIDRVRCSSRTPQMVQRSLRMRGEKRQSILSPSSRMAETESSASARPHGNNPKKRIHVLDEAELRNAFVSEVVGFPGEFDDQVDAMSQYLSFMATKPLLKLPPPPAIAVGVGFSLGPLSPLSLTTGRTFTSAPKIFNR